MLDLILLFISAIALIYIFFLGFSQLRNRPFIVRILHLNILFLLLLLPVYLSFMLYSFRWGEGWGEQLFGVINPLLLLIIFFLYLLFRYRRSFIVYNSNPLRIREEARGLMDSRGWSYREEENRILLRRPRGEISFINQWPGVSVVHTRVPGEELLERDLRERVKRLKTTPNLFSGIINLLMAFFLLFFFLMVVF